MPDWTPQQDNAINAKNRNILVSAAAGSGKTAVLVERVKQIVTDKNNPVEPDKLLIVTFTKAAAAEMKYRISNALSDCIKSEPNESFYKKQLALLPNANICTIDSFCGILVKEHFYELGISQDYSVLDDSELQIIQTGIINDVIDEYFEANDQDFISLIEAFTTPGKEKNLISTIEKIIYFIYSQPFPFLWLDKSLELLNPDIPFNKTIWYDYIISELKYLIDYGISLVKRNIELVDLCGESADKFALTFSADLAEFERYNKALCGNWNDLVSIIPPSFATLPKTTKLDKAVADEIKGNRDLYKSILNSSISKFFISSEEDYKEDMKLVYPQLETLIKLVKEVCTRLMNEKKERNTFSFSDILHFSIDLLFSVDKNGNIIKTDIANNLSNKYYEILVDEYQDTNEAQDLLFTYLSNGKNLFTVGDIKQSIYRFRLAMPNIFNSKKKAYPIYDKNDNSNFSKIILDKNFRSRREICSYVNYVFSTVMSEKIGELEYNQEEYLNCGAKYPETNNPSASMYFIDNNKGDEKNKTEAQCIAKYILNKVKSGELIKDGDKLRPVNYGDFVILMRSTKGRISEYADVLTKYGIPVVCDNTTNLFENSEIRLLLSLLKTIDNPTNDIALLSTMMSPFYGFNADELAKYRIDSNEQSFHKSIFSSQDKKVVAFRNDLMELKKISVTMSVSSFIRYIVKDKGIISYINALGNGEQRYQNILKFISFAKSFDNGSNVGLTAFIRYINKIIESEKNVDSASLSCGSNNAVTIMTVHHSKGLEFPICIYAGTSKSYNFQDLSSKLLLNTDLGMAIKCHDEESLSQYKTIPYLVIAQKNYYEIMSENLRVLYVAMTRAKEQFVTFASYRNLTNAAKKISSFISNGQVSPYIMSKMNNDADIFLMCALLHRDGKILRELNDSQIKTKTADFNMDIHIIDDAEFLEEEINYSFVDYDENIVNEIASKLSYSYDRISLNGLSGKLVASSLDNIDGGFEYITSSKPSFLNQKGLTPAQRGTAMHTFMQFCDYQLAKDDLSAEIERITNNGYITIQQAESLNTSSLKKFFESDLAKRMFKSDRIYREIKISNFVKANEIYDTDFEDDILVQGIADCVFEENGELVIVDYKTDRVADENELLNRYNKQINFYKKAIEETLEKPIKSTVLYSFYLNKVCYYK